MKHFFRLVLALTPITLLAVSAVQADSGEKMVIALKTHHFEIGETDIGSLAVGESQTIETDSGKLIDILRTNDGVEIYVDGELLDMDFKAQGLHQKHFFKKHINFTCEGEDNCDENVFMIAERFGEAAAWEDAHGQHGIKHKSMSFSCTSDEEQTDCSDKLVWIAEGEERDLGELHRLHAADGAHKVIVIKKEVIDEN